MAGDEAGKKGDQKNGKPPSAPAAATKPASTPKRMSGQAGDALGEDVLGWFNKRNGATLTGAQAFVPSILMQAHSEGTLTESQIVVHRGQGAVIFSDASGFTALTEGLSNKSNGAELLSECLENFFTPLIELITAYRGDVIKFSGDALMIYVQAVDDTRGRADNSKTVPPHGTYGLQDIGPMATAVLRASACCIEIHKKLHNFPTGVDDIFLCMHIGVGCGQVHILQVGGVVPPETKVQRCEYIIAGQPIEQIAIAEPLAKNGETCLSAQAWEYVKDCVIEGAPLEKQPDYHLLLRMDDSKYTFPTIKHAAIENDRRKDYMFKLQELKILRRYIPSSVYKQIEQGTLQYVNEMRNISTIFINGKGLDVTSDRGAQVCQELMCSVQRCCYAHEGTLNKFLFDDKGMLFLLVFGLPPLVHTDDPTRAVLACFDMVKVFKRLDLVGKFGVTTSRSYCGLCGSSSRMEYTVLGDSVNLAARLMGAAQSNGILCDLETKNRSNSEIVWNALHPIMVKGKSALIPVFQPVKAEPAANIGLTPDKKVRFPWYEHPFGGLASSSANAMQLSVQQLCSVKTWSGIMKVQEMLGGSFSKTFHQNDSSINLSSQTQPPAPGTPFADGGAVVLESKEGMGKVELAEHIVMYAAIKFLMMPIFGTIGPRPGGAVRLSISLLRSALGLFRHCLGTSLPESDYDALAQLAPPHCKDLLPILRQALEDQVPKEKTTHALEQCMKLVMELLKILAKATPVIIVMRLEFGTSRFPKVNEDEGVFWKVISQLAELDSVKNPKAAGLKPAVLMILCTEAEPTNIAVQIAKKSDTLLTLAGLTDENILEYMSNYLSVPEGMIPMALKNFVAKVTLGNPYFIRETINQLQDDSHILVNCGANKQPRSLECKELDKINISSWQHTAMVGLTKNLLESLDPLEAAVVKMSTCFVGTFTLPDLAAYICSRWAGAAYFDSLRLFKAIQILVDRAIVERVDAPPEERQNSSGNEHKTGEGGGGDSPRSPREKLFGTTQYFQTTNLLIRAVGGAMVLEAQKKSVKRQALIERALLRELPARMEVQHAKKERPHIPWYYEQAFRRMP